MRQVEKLLNRLDGVREGKSGWMAKCPAHEDRGPSLSITEKDGKVLVHCFAGCMPGDVIAAVGLTWRDLGSKAKDPRPKTSIHALHREAEDLRRAAL